VRWPIPLGVCAVVLVLSSATPASAVVVHGRGLHAEAAFDADALGRGHRAIQVFDELCANPDHQRRCEPIEPALQRAITKAAGRPITWVDHPTPHEGKFWVLAPIRFGADTARVRWAWRDLHTYGCFGGGSLTYERHHGAWTVVLGILYEGCTVRG
jgi:hypothetical protein